MCYYLQTQPVCRRCNGYVGSVILTAMICPSAYGTFGGCPELAGGSNPRVVDKTAVSLWFCVPCQRKYDRLRR
ncbi:hypothetical protein CC79DRAFT_475126 [Sarocladium strictum]